MLVADSIQMTFNDFKPVLESYVAIQAVYIHIPIAVDVWHHNISLRSWWIKRDSALLEGLLRSTWRCCLEFSLLSYRCETHLLTVICLNVVMSIIWYCFRYLIFFAFFQFYFFIHAFKCMQDPLHSTYQRFFEIFNVVINLFIKLPFFFLQSINTPKSLLIFKIYSSSIFYSLFLSHTLLSHISNIRYP